MKANLPEESSSDVFSAKMGRRGCTAKQHMATSSLLKSRGLSHGSWAHVEGFLLRRKIRPIAVPCMCRKSSILREKMGEGGARICVSIGMFLSGLWPNRDHEICLLQAVLVWRRHERDRSMALQILPCRVSLRLVTSVVCEVHTASRMPFLYVKDIA
jgi:hypothetical protein